MRDVFGCLSVRFICLCFSLIDDGLCECCLDRYSCRISTNKSTVGEQACTQ